MNSRAGVEPILQAIPAARQEDARHYGVHPYFTRRPANVVRAYLERYSQQGDVVLDPFGGTGVTAIEAFLLGRSAIQNDLNPFANFIARNIADTTLASTAALRQAFERAAQACSRQVHEIEKDEAVAQQWLKRLPLPENIRLPRNSDADYFYDLFTPRQLAGVALIKQTIERETGPARDLLLLAWSASLAKLNKTFLSAKGRAESRGGSSIFSIYRYKLAARSVELPIWETFHGRFLNVLAAKEEVLQLHDYRAKPSGGSLDLDSERNFRVLARDAATLDKVIKPGSVDYIFTDPPYGAFIKLSGSFHSVESLAWFSDRGGNPRGGDHCRRRTRPLRGALQAKPGAQHQNLVPPFETRPLVFHRLSTLGQQLLCHNS